MNAASVIPSEESHVRSLDGEWRFKLEQRDEYSNHRGINQGLEPIILPEHPEQFQAPDYKEDSSWHEMIVPGNWEMAGDSPATYQYADNTIGLYRLWFEIPAAWEGRMVKINFDGVQNAAEVFCNGEPVLVDESSWGRANYHESGYTAFQADLTPVVKFGGKNLLALRVFKNSRSVDLDTGDYFLLGGIYRSVTLFSVTPIHIWDFAFRTTVDPGLKKAELRVLVNVAGKAQGAKVSMQLEGYPSIEALLDSKCHAELRQTLENPRLWSAEHPNLYRFRLDLDDSQGNRLEHIARRVGVREVSIEKGVFMVNHVPVKLTGMCRHEIHATLGSALNEDVWRKDLVMMKAANVNAVRTSHYPYGSLFYDLCDELGLYVADEVNACSCPTDREELAPAFAQRAREMTRRDLNHPSIIIWAVGNENKKGPNNRVAADEIRKLDPTRPRLISWRDADEADVELDDRHYTTPGAIAKANADERRSRFPMIYLENPNNWEARNGADYGCIDRWAAIIDRTWSEVWKDEHIPGSFLWEWQDRGIADQCLEKLYDHFPHTGINLVKVKGICDAFRNPRPSYYHVKMAYAPITIDLQPRIEGGLVIVNAVNRYSFTDLSELTATWCLLSDGKELESASTHVALAPLTSGPIRFDLPKDALAFADSLRLDFDHPDGRNIATYLLHIRPEPNHTPILETMDSAGPAFPRFNLVTVDFRNNRIGWREACRHRARLINIAVQRAGDAMNQTKNLNAPAGLSGIEDDGVLESTPLAEICAMEADVTLPDISTKQVVGHVIADIANGQFAYKVDWFGGKADIQELGWIFRMPESYNRFSWHRQGYWSYYPETHIGRISGTATPDSANLDVSKFTRPDAFDFNSTKYDCDWAVLAAKDGQGLGVVFAADDRHHCRSGTSIDWRCLLVVNKQCSPPRDYSSGIVPDYYLTFNKGSRVEGSFIVGRIIFKGSNTDSE